MSCGIHLLCRQHKKLLVCACHDDMVASLMAKIHLCSCKMPCVFCVLQEAELLCSDKVCAERPDPAEMCALKGTSEG